MFFTRSKWHRKCFFTNYAPGFGFVLTTLNWLLMLSEVVSLCADKWKGEKWGKYLFTFSSLTKVVCICMNLTDAADYVTHVKVSCRTCHSALGQWQTNVNDCLSICQLLFAVCPTGLVLIGPQLRHQRGHSDWLWPSPICDYFHDWMKKSGVKDLCNPYPRR